MLVILNMNSASLSWMEASFQILLFSFPCTYVVYSTIEIAYNVTLYHRIRGKQCVISRARQ